MCFHQTDAKIPQEDKTNYGRYVNSQPVEHSARRTGVSQYINSELTEEFSLKGIKREKLLI
jgi:hypothetical protein